MNKSLSTLNRIQDGKQLRALEAARKDPRQKSLLGPSHEAELQAQALLNGSKAHTAMRAKAATSKAAKAVAAIATAGPHVTSPATAKAQRRRAPKAKPVKGTVSRKNGVHPNVYQVFRDVNGVAYLRVELNEESAGFVVNKGFHVDLIHINSHHARQALYLQPVVGASIFACAKNLLHPLNENVTISVLAQEALKRILENKELQMKATENTKPTKFASVNAPAAKNSKKAAAAPAVKAKPAKAVKASNGAAPAAAVSELYQTKVVATKAATEQREGSFFHTVGALASKPITLERLISAVAAKVELRSGQDAEKVCRVRVRDAFTRLGFLKEAK
jgi:hypothetical protein